MFGEGHLGIRVRPEGFLRNLDGQEPQPGAQTRRYEMMKALRAIPELWGLFVSDEPVCDRSQGLASLRAVPHCQVAKGFEGW